ncbi:MAG TPA: hypothetical protein PKC43_12470 [Phycisphaerales bacterium]|nr:hypothetical protein [Phycisphaerales bacterium]HMP38247.1 hypothetical protein [Phycisphaerales bacterium]
MSLEHPRNDVPKHAVDRRDGAAAPLPAGSAETTSVPPPRHRIFLPSTGVERFRAMLWSGARATLFRCSPPFMNRWRVWLLRRFGARVGRGVSIDPSVIVRYPWRLAIADGCVIAHRVILDCMGEIAVGARTRISQYAHLCAGTHDYTRPDMQIVRRPITVGADVWIAADVFVGPGVTVADGTVVAARSSVFHDLPDGVIAAGEPATVRRERAARSSPTDAAARPVRS